MMEKLYTEEVLEEVRKALAAGMEGQVQVVQTRLLLEIRDLLAEMVEKQTNPMMQVEPRRRVLRRRFRTTWICALEHKATFKCVDCRSLVKVPEDHMRGLPGPWMPLSCRRCGREFELDGRELGGDIGKMMRAFFPDEPVEAEVAPGDDPMPLPPREDEP